MTVYRMRLGMKVTYAPGLPIGAMGLCVETLTNILASRKSYLHLRDGSLGARVGPESRERGLCALDHEHGGMRGVQPSREKSSYSLLDILVGLASWEVRSALECRRRGEDVRAVNESVRVVSELSHSTEDELEPVL